jgi:hypothetical protein
MTTHQPSLAGRSCILALALAFALTAAAGAQTIISGGTSAFTSADTPISSDPSGAIWQTDTLHVFSRSAPTGGLWHTRREGGVWKEPEDLGGVLVGGPAVARNTNGLNVFVRGTNDALFRKVWDGSRWSDWEQVSDAGAITSDPAATSWGPGRIHVFARGNPDGLWHRWFEDGVWKGPENLGGGLIGGPGVAALNLNSMDVFVRGTTSAVWRKRWEGSWKEWERISPDGAITSDPEAVASWGPDRIRVFARGNPDGLWHMWLEGGVWKGPENLGGGLVGGAAAVGPNTSGLDVFVRGTDNALWNRRWSVDRWLDWVAAKPGPVQQTTQTTQTIQMTQTTQTFNITPTNLTTALDSSYLDAQKIKVVEMKTLNNMFAMRDKRYPDQCIGVNYFPNDLVEPPTPGTVRSSVQTGMFIRKFWVAGTGPSGKPNCIDKDARVWFVREDIPGQAGWFRLRFLDTNFCLDSFSNTEGAQIRIETCNNSTQQMWGIHPNGEALVAATSSMLQNQDVPLSPANMLDLGRAEPLCLALQNGFVTKKCVNGYLPMIFDPFPVWKYRDDMVGGQPGF